MAVEHIEGRDSGSVMLYALSTCIWCKKTRQLLEELGIAYDYEYVDLLQGAEQAKAMQTIRHVNPSLSFPTLIINEQVIIGFQESKIRDTLNHER